MTDKKKKQKRKVLHSKYSPGLVIIVFTIVSFSFIYFGYRQMYIQSIDNNLSLVKISDRLIKTNYIEVEQTVQINGEEKVITVLEKKVKIVKKPKPVEREVKAIYLTGYGVTSSIIYNRALRLLDETELNAVIIDIKDYSGQLSYVSNVQLAKEMGADKSPKIKDMKKIIDELHAKDVYVIARQTVFQDPIISKNKPEWAVMNSDTGHVWVDRKGIGWSDPSVREVWDYNIEIAKEAVSLGFDEINLDYIRFPTDGKLSAIRFHNYEKGKPKNETIRDFIKYFSEEMNDEPAYISVDFFGLVTVKVKENDDLGIGQLLIDAVPYVDYISPMVYPSHYATNFNGYANPALYPYEIVKYSMDKANDVYKEEYLGELKPRAKMRPWLQDFDMGAVYDSSMVRAQIKAAKDAGTFGWLLWDPRNMYTEGALEKVENIQ